MCKEVKIVLDQLGVKDAADAKSGDIGSESVVL
jgi:hypothetical protein